MIRKTLVLTGLLLAGGTAMAQTSTLPTITVRGVDDSVAALSYDCNNLQEPSLTDVESLLQIKDPEQTKMLSKKLRFAVGEACQAGVPAITVTRGKDGQSLTWAPSEVSEATKTVTQ